MQPLRIAVLGHVEHITLGRVPALPGPGDIAHLAGLEVFPGGGGGMAFQQLSKSPAEVHLFTAVGDDDAGRWIADELGKRRAVVHWVKRAQPHTRDVVLVPPTGDRTIVVIGEPLHPRASDALPYDLLSSCDAAYFTAQDPQLLRLARAARRLVVTARRQEALRASGVKADVVVGSARDPRERSALEDYAPAPEALVMTEAEQGGYVQTKQGRARFAPAAAAPREGVAYGAGDSFAGALTYFLASGLPVLEAAGHASAYGAAVVGAEHPIRGQLALPAL